MAFTTTAASAQPFDHLYYQYIFPSQVNAIERTLDGDFVVSGTLWGDLWLLKLDHNGDTLWSRTYDGVQDAGYSKLSVTSDGGLLIAGSRMESDSLGYDLHLFRTDENGQVLWHKSYGGEGQQWLMNMTLTSDGGALLVGGSGYAGCLVRIDDQGDTLWTRVFGGYRWIEAACIIPGSTDLMLTGFGEYQSEFRALITRITDFGEVVWAQLFDPGAEMNGQAIVPTDDGFIIGGWINYGIGLLSIDTAGNTQWALKVGDDGAGLHDLRRLGNGDLLVSGEYQSDPIWMRVSSTGNVIWSERIPIPANYDLRSGACEDGDSLVLFNNYWITYTHYYPRVRRIGPDGGGGSCSLEPLTLESTFPNFYDPIPISMVTIPSTWIVETLPPPAIVGRSVQVLDCMYAGIERPTERPTITLYPDPADASIQLEYGSGRMPDQMAVFNCAGEALAVPMTASTTMTRIDTHALPNGIYVIRAAIDGQDVSARFVVMH